MAVEPLARLYTGGDLPAIVLIHGMTFSKLPGHGESSGSGADPMLVVERIHPTVVENGMVDPVVVGHSAGALHATGYGFAHESAGVVNVDQSLQVGPFAGFVQSLAPALRGEDFDAAFEPFAVIIGIGRLPRA